MKQPENNLVRQISNLSSSRVGDPAILMTYYLNWDHFSVCSAERLIEHKSLISTPQG